MNYIASAIPLFLPPRSSASFGQFAAVLGASTVYLQQQDASSRDARALGALLIVWSLMSLGGLLDGRRFALRPEKGFPCRPELR